jgi:beta-glucosidase
MIDRRTVLTAAAMTGLAGMAASPLRAAGRAANPHFPQGFLWGAATAAHQVEGNNTNSCVWAMEHAHPTVYAEPSGDAANSFMLWRTDLDLVKDMGLNSYRFSLEWARIEPAKGEFSIAMLEHYKAMIAGCRERGLTPLVTFNHFSTPVWFAAQGGWSNPEAPSLFARYCEHAARQLAGEIGYATTLNEPNLSGLLDIVLPGDIGKRLLDADRQMQEAAAREHGVARFLPGNPLYVADPQVVQAGLLAGHKAGREAIKRCAPICRSASASRSSTIRRRAGTACAMPCAPSSTAPGWRRRAAMISSACRITSARSGPTRAACPRPRERN